VDGSVVVINGYFPRLSLKELAATVLSVLGRGAAEELRSHTLQVRESPCTRYLTPSHAERGCFEFEDKGCSKAETRPTRLHVSTALQSVRHKCVSIQGAVRLTLCFCLLLGLFHSICVRMCDG